MLTNTITTKFFLRLKPIRNIILNSFFLMIFCDIFVGMCVGLGQFFPRDNRKLKIHGSSENFFPSRPTLRDFA